MMIIPKELKDVDLDTITPNFKYTTVHIGMVEKASQTGRPPKLPGHILLEEWSTSGRIRPTVDHLIKLLVRANLFRAADYLAEILQGKSISGFSTDIPLIFINHDQYLQKNDQPGL